MASNIYDIAKILSGDPLGEASERGKEASTIFAQYEHQKDIIDEINAAIAAAQRKAKKNKFGFGLGGSALGGLLGLAGTALLPAGAPLWQQLAMTAGGAGAGAFGAEKIRQGEWLSELTGREKITKELSEAKEKFKGRKQATDIEGTEEIFEKQLDEMLMSDVTSSMLTSLIFPAIKEGAKDIFTPVSEVGGKSWFDIPVSKAEESINTQIGENLFTDTGEKAFKGVSPEGIETILTSGEYDVNSILNKDQIMNIQDTIGVSKDGIWGTESIAAYEAALPNISVDSSGQSILQDYGQTGIEIGTTPGKGFKMEFDPMGMAPDWAKDKLPFLSKPWAGMLGRGLGPAAWGQFAYPESVVDPYTTEPFRNPYKRGY